LKKVESLRPFVMAIAIRRAQEEIKRRRVRRLVRALLGDTIMGADHRPRWSRRPARRSCHLYRVIDRLQRDGQDHLRAPLHRGLEQRQISEALGVSVSTVRRRLDRLAKRVNHMMSRDPVLSEYVESRPGALARTGARENRAVKRRSPPSTDGEHPHFLLGSIVRNGFRRVATALRSR
jgi:hypothetical protein